MVFVIESLDRLNCKFAQMCLIKSGVTWAYGCFDFSPFKYRGRLRFCILIIMYLLPCNPNLTQYLSLYFSSEAG